MFEDVELTCLGTLPRVFSARTELVATQVPGSEVGGANTWRIHVIQQVSCVALPHTCSRVAPTGRGRGRRKRGRSRVDGTETTRDVATALVALACSVVSCARGGAGRNECIARPLAKHAVIGIVAARQAALRCKSCGVLYAARAADRDGRGVASQLLARVA